MNKTRTIIALSAVLLALVPGFATAHEVAYAKPSPEVEEMILAQPLPKIAFNPQMTEGVIYQALEKYQPLSYIENIREFKVGGLRLNGDNFSQTRKSFYGRVELITSATGATRVIAGLPDGLMAHDFGWSPDGRWLCFLNDTPKEVELYRVDVTARAPVAVKINSRPVNSIFGDAYAFVGNDAVLYKSVPQDLGEFPTRELPKGPIVQSSKNASTEFRTYQDLIKSPYDEAVFEYLCTAELSLFDGNTTRTVGKKGVISSFKVSPDGNYIILSTLHKPYSYTKTYANFFKRIVLTDMQGKVLRPLKKQGNPPKGAPVHSMWEWRADKPASLVFKVKTVKDKKASYTLFQADAPFAIKENRKLVTADADIVDVLWYDDNTALYIERSDSEKKRRIKTFNPSDSTAAPVTVHTEDLHDWGTNVKVFAGTLCKQHGTDKVLVDPKDRTVLLSGNKRMDEHGLLYSYIDRISLKDGKSETIWASVPVYKVSQVSVISHSR